MLGSHTVPQEERERESLLGTGEKKGWEGTEGQEGIYDIEMVYTFLHSYYTIFEKILSGFSFRVKNGFFFSLSALFGLWV